MRRQIQKIVLCFLCPSIVCATTYYVGPQGSDSNSGQSESQAWQTFAHALNRITSPGDDTLTILDGTYDEQLRIENKKGVDRDHPFTVKGKNPGKVELRTSGTAISIKGVSSPCENITLQDLTIRGSNQGVNVVNSIGVTLKRISVFQATYVGIWFYDKNYNFTVTECRVEDMKNPAKTGTGTDGWGIRVNDETGTQKGRGKIEKSIFRNGWRAGARLQETYVDLYDNVFDTWGGEGSRDHCAYVGNGSPSYEGASSGEQVTIERNTFKNSLGWGLKLSSGMQNVTVKNNIFATNDDGGLSIEHGKNKNIKVFNNLFYENVMNVTAFGKEPDKGIQIKNNIFYAESHDLLLIMNGSTDQLEVDYNCYHNLDGSARLVMALFDPRRYTKYEDLDTWTKAWDTTYQLKGVDAHSIPADPKMVNPQAEEYQLQPGSPCVDMGPSAYTDIGPSAPTGLSVK